MNKRNQIQCRGVAMVEFAIILPMMLMLLFAVTEIGRALYQQNTLYKAVESGARYLARKNGVLEYENGNCTYTGSDWPDASSLYNANNLIIYGNIIGSGSPLLPNLDESDVITVQVSQKPLRKTDTDEGEQTVCVVTVNADVPFAGLFGEIAIPFTTIPSFHIVAETEERYIGL